MGIECRITNQKLKTFKMLPGEQEKKYIATRALKTPAKREKNLRIIIL